MTDTPEHPRFFSTKEVADYLRMKERTVYDLVRDRQIPSVRVAGKWMFPRELIDRWIDENTDTSSLSPKGNSTPAVLAGSHDPLLDWAVRESGCGLATLCRGSSDGIAQVRERRAMLAATHLLDGDSGEYNLREFDALAHRGSFVLIEWARRRQGLVLAPGNPLAVASLADAVERSARFAMRPDGSGAARLLQTLLARAAIDPARLAPAELTAHGEADVAEAVAEGRADAGLAIESVARQHRLEFVPLHDERVDLLVRRFDWFEPPVQALVRFCGTERFRARAATLAGYDVGGLGRVIRNG